jgi:hypothetical protein
MAICGAIFKYNVNNFNFYVLEILDNNIKDRKYLSERENY